MAIDPATIREYTDGELVKIYRWAIAENAAGQTRTFGKKTITFPPLETMLKFIEWAEARISADAESPVMLGAFERAT